VLDNLSRDLLSSFFISEEQKAYTTYPTALDYVIDKLNLLSFLSLLLGV